MTDLTSSGVLSREGVTVPSVDVDLVLGAVRDIEFLPAGFDPLSISRRSEREKNNKMMMIEGVTHVTFRVKVIAR